MTPDLGTHIELARSWLVGAALPLWIEHGVDWNGHGYFDSLDPSLIANVSPAKRLRTTARQIYVFCEADALGVPRSREAVEHGLRFLLSRARHPDGAFASHFDLGGTPTADQRDTYDLAFVLFALAHAHRLTGDDALEDVALDLLAFFETRLRSPDGGYEEGVPAQATRRQNPHMHLFEASLAWLPSDRTGSFGHLADEMVRLLETRFLDPASGAVLEYFGSDLTFAPERDREAVEPGHLFEWAWLLAEYERLRGRRSQGCDRLYGFARRHGIDHTTGLLYGEILRCGSVADRSVRVWPHAEWVRAEIVAYGREPEVGTGRLRQALDALWTFIDANRPGLWSERFDGATRTFAAGPVPATTLYHIVGAVRALLDMVASHGTVADVRRHCVGTGSPSRRAAPQPASSGSPA